MRPLLIQFTPAGLKTAVYYRFYRKHRDRWPELYEAASLHYAPGVIMSLSPTDEGHGEIAFTGIYELDLTKKLAKHGRNGGVLVDVGGNYGYFSLLWTAQNPKSRVIVFEASPRNHAAISANIATNHFEERIEFRPEAVGKERGRLQFSLGPAGQTGWGGMSLGAGEGDKVDVTVIRLDETVAHLPFIDVLKIDIEGADTWAIMGAEGLLRDKRIGAVYYEENRDRMAQLGIKAGQAKSFLNALDYHVEALGEEDARLVEYHAIAK